MGNVEEEGYREIQLAYEIRMYDLEINERQ